MNWISWWFFCIAIVASFLVFLRALNDMAANHSQSPLPIILGILIPIFIAAAPFVFWFGGVPSQLARVQKDIGELRLQVQDDIGDLQTEVYKADTSLKARTSRIETTLEDIRVRTIREDYDREIGRLNSQISSLRSQLDQLRKDNQTLRSRLR